MLDLRTITGGAAAILTTAMEDKKWPPAAVPVIATAFVFEIAHQRAVTHCYNLVYTALRRDYDMFVMSNGEYPAEASADERDEWLAACETITESVLEPYQAVLSASWLYTAIDMHLYEPNAVEQLARMFADEVWKNLTYYHSKTDGRALSRTEVLLACDLDEEAIMSLVNSKKPQEVEPMTNTDMNAYEIEATFARFSQNSGLMPKNDVLDMLDQASDEDDGLALSAAQVLGGTLVDVRALRQYKEENFIFDADGWSDAYDLIVQACSGTYVGAEVGHTDPLLTGGAPTPEEEEMDAEMAEMMGLTPAAPAPIAAPAVARPPAPAAAHLADPVPPAATPRPAPPAAPAVGSQTSGVVSGEALRLIKEATGKKSDDLGTLCGVSRATFDNYAKGKGQFVPEHQHRQNLIGLIDATVAQLTTARGLLDTD